VEEHQKMTVTLITGANKGLGYETARRLIERGHTIYLGARNVVSMLTVQYAKTFPGIKFNAVEPGFTTTDLTPCSGAGQPVERGAEVITRMAIISNDGPTGSFQEGDGELAW
jgi:NAD(P)-dependent dehydrogenase (short-subunit alcohol dehydrogenase family)